MTSLSRDVAVGELGAMVAAQAWRSRIHRGARSPAIDPTRAGPVYRRD
jgi:hypothetical protein